MPCFCSEGLIQNVSYSPTPFPFISESDSCSECQGISTELSNANTKIQRPDLNLFTSHVISVWLWAVVPPIIFVLGTFGNIMNVIILLRIRSGTINIFFLALSVTDTCLLYSGLLTIWLKKSFGISLQDLHVFYCKFVYFIMYVSGVLSAWLLVAMSVQRTMSIVWPHRVAFVFSKGKSFYFLLGIIGFVLILHSHLLYGMEFKSISNSSFICTAVSKEYYMFFTIIWSWVDLTLFSLFPFILLSISNGVLIFALKMSVRDLKTNADHSRNVANRERKTSSVTKTLIFLSLSFCLLSSPYCIYLLFTGLTDYEEKRLTDYSYRSALDLVLTFVCLMWYLNSAISFCLYCLTGTKFRTEFLTIVCQRSKWLGQHWVDNNLTQKCTRITMTQAFHSETDE